MSANYFKKFLPHKPFSYSEDFIAKTFKDLHTTFVWIYVW